MLQNPSVKRQMCDRCNIELDADKIRVFWVTIYFDYFSLLPIKKAVAVGAARIALCTYNVPTYVHMLCISQAIILNIKLLWEHFQGQNKRSV